MHICVTKLTIIGSDIGLSPGRRQAIIWTNARILLTGPLETNISEILITIHTCSCKKMHLKMSSGKCRPFCLGFNVLITEHIPCNMHMDLFCFDDITVLDLFMWIIYLYLPGLFHCTGNHAIVPMQVKRPWMIWVKLFGSYSHSKHDNCVYVYENKHGKQHMNNTKPTTSWGLYNW